MGKAQYVYNRKTKHFVKVGTRTFRTLPPADRRRRYTTAQMRAARAQRKQGSRDQEKQIYRKLYKERPDLRQRALRECPDNTEQCLREIFADIPGVAAKFKRGKSVSFRRGADVVTIATSRANKGLKKVRHSSLPDVEKMKIIRTALLRQQDDAITSGDMRLNKEILSVLASFGTPESGFRDLIDKAQMPTLPKFIYLPGKATKGTTTTMGSSISSGGTAGGTAGGTGGGGTGGGTTRRRRTGYFGPARPSSSSRPQPDAPAQPQRQPQRQQQQASQQAPQTTAKQAPKQASQPASQPASQQASQQAAPQTHATPKQAPTKAAVRIPKAKAAEPAKQKPKEPTQRTVSVPVFAPASPDDVKKLKTLFNKATRYMAQQAEDRPEALGSGGAVSGIEGKRNQNDLKQKVRAELSAKYGYSPADIASKAMKACIGQTNQQQCTRDLENERDARLDEFFKEQPGGYNGYMRELAKDYVYEPTWIGAEESDNVAKPFEWVDEVEKTGRKATLAPWNAQDDYKLFEAEIALKDFMPKRQEIYKDYGTEDFTDAYALCKGKPCWKRQLDAYKEDVIDKKKPHVQGTLLSKLFTELLLSSVITSKEFSKGSADIEIGAADSAIKAWQDLRTDFKKDTTGWRTATDTFQENYDTWQRLELRKVLLAEAEAAKATASDGTYFSSLMPRRRRGRSMLPAPGRTVPLPGPTLPMMPAMPVPPPPVRPPPREAREILLLKSMNMW
jgi:hypothetical protein